MSATSRTAALWLALALGVVACGDGSNAPHDDAAHDDASAGAPHRFYDTELLLDPRADGVTLALMAAEPLLLSARYGVGDARTRSTPERRADPGRVCAFDLGELPPDTRVSYQVFARRPHEDQPRAREVHGFRTLAAPTTRDDAAPARELRFAVAADPHAFQNWAQFRCRDNDTGWRTLDASLARLARLAADRELDFLLIGTDSAMTKCGGGCPSCELAGVSIAAKDSVGIDDAALRYRTVFGPEVYGRVAADLPLLYMLGDHDGERGFGSVEGTCGYTLEERVWSREARRRTLPPGPSPVDDALYYSVRHGPLQILVLDALNGTTLPPVEPEAWSLGAEQLAWFERTLAESDATFKFVFAEHLLGGLRAPEGRKASICWKARGGITATEDGTPRGRFVGEQAVVQALMKQHGAQLFVSFHDHVAAFGEKLEADGSGSGVGYLIAGQCAGPPLGEVAPSPPPWSNEPWYRQAMDYDGDGVPEFESELTGTLEKGVFFARVVGHERVELDYLRSDPDPARDGERILHLVITPEGPVTPTR